MLFAVQSRGEGSSILHLEPPKLNIIEPTAEIALTS
jgi:hypothetical protein